MKIQYYRKKCISCGSCVIRAPQIWKMNMDDGKADLINGELKKDVYFCAFWHDEKQLLKEIETICPTHAIKLV